MKTYTLELFAQQLVVQVDGNGGGEILSGLDRTTCPSCGSAECCFSCDGSQYEENAESETDVVERLSYNSLLDGMESLVLAHACAGFDISDPRYVSGIKTMISSYQE